MPSTGRRLTPTTRESRHGTLFASARPIPLDAPVIQIKLFAINPC